MQDELEGGRKTEAADKPPHSIEAKSKIASPFPKAEPATPPQNQPWADRKKPPSLNFHILPWQSEGRWATCSIQPRGSARALSSVWTWVQIRAQ